MVIKAFRPLFLISLALAILAFVTPLAGRPASTDSAIKASAVMAATWIAIVVYAFAKFKKRGLWFLLRHAPDWLLVFRPFCNCLGLRSQHQGLPLTSSLIG